MVRGLVAEVSPLADAISVNAPAVPVIEQPEKAATPLTAVTGLVVQTSVPVPEVSARVTAAEEVVTVLPPES